MQTFLYPHKYPEEFFRPGRAHIYVPLLPLAARLLKITDLFPSNPEMAKITGGDLLRDMKVGYDMTRRRKNGISHGDDGGNTGKSSGGGRFRWCNVPLTVEDMAFLTDSADTMELLSAAVLALVDDGYGFSCKPANKGASVCATLLKNFGDNNPDTVALAAFGGTTRDAILALLYKFDNHLGGEIPPIDQLPDNQSSRFG